MRSHFDFQVASSESFQLPTLKQLIGHQSDSTFNNEEESIRFTQPSLPSSSYFPLKENSLRRSFTKQKVADTPVQILDEKNDDLDKLLLSRVPQNKLNRTILHTVQKIKVVDPNNLEKDDNFEYVEGVSNTNLLTNELLMKQRRALNDVKEISTTEKSLEFERSASTYRGRSNRRRIKVDPSSSKSTEDSIDSQNTSVLTNEYISSQNTPVKLSTKEPIVQITENASTQSTPVVQNTEPSLPANPRAADIERARRRRIRLNSSQVTSGPIHKNQNSHIRGRPSRRRNRVDVPDSTTSTSVSITTSRGTTLPGTTSDFPRGFLLTRNIDDILVTRVDKLSTVSIQSTDPSTLSPTEKTFYSGKSFTESPTTTEYSETSTTSSPLIEDINQEGETNFFVTTTGIAQENEDYNQAMGTTTEISETIVPKLQDDEIVTSGDISTTERASTLPHRYIKRKKIRKIKPVSSTELSDLESLRSSNEDKNILLEETTDSSFTNPDTFTLDSISFTPSDSASFTPGPTTFSTSDATSVTSTSITLSTPTAPTFESTIFTTENPLREQSTLSENLFAREELVVTEASDSVPTTEYILLKTDDFIKPNSNFVEFNTERPDSFTTKLYVQDRTNSYDDFDKQNLETKDAEIRGQDVTTEKGDSILSTLSQFSNTETTPKSIDQNETATSIVKASITNSSIVNDSSLIKTHNQISTESPMKITKKVVDDLVSSSDRPTNSRRRVLKRKRQRIDPKVEEKSMEVAKTETIEVILKKEENPTTPATISSSSPAPESEKPTRKRVVVYRGSRRFSSRTTPPTVQSSSNTKDHPNQIASRRRTKKVVRKRPKLSSAEIPESDLNTSDDESNREGKHLSLDPETKSYDDADQAGSEVNEKSVNVYKSSPPTSRRPGSVYHREPSRIRSRASTHQPQTTTQPSLRRFNSPSTGRQSLYFEQTTLPPKIRFSSVDDAAILLEHLARIEDQRAENDDQTNRAHEVVLEDPETTPSTTEPGHSSLKTSLWRKISTTETPKILSTTAIPAFRRQQGQKYYGGVISQNLPQRPRRPAIVDYDYYQDEEIRFVGKPRLNGKLYVTSRGSINCLDQGNFPHPTSCRKFITCARMVTGLVVGTEYTCPDKLSYDPIGGICNWSAGLGCKE